MLEDYYNIEEYKKSKNRDLINCHCTRCGSFYKRSKHHIYVSIKKNSEKLFCSKKCSELFKQRRTMSSCLRCNKEITILPCQILFKKFCSRQCCAKFYNKTRRKISDQSFSFKNFLSIGARKQFYVPLSLKKLYKYFDHTPTLKYPKNQNCIICQNKCEDLRKTCSSVCKSQSIRLGAFKSVAKQAISRRSKNEQLFGELCKNKFKIVIFNQQIFNGWDADVILQNEKIAVLWNGRWHYSKITQKHSVEQVQNRDRIKEKEIISADFTPYIIKDLGSFDPGFVKQKFEEFCDWLKNR